MKLRTSELTGVALDWAVMQCEGLTPTIEPDGYLHVGNVQWRPSRNWQDGGPIIEREGINLNKSFDGWWASYKPSVHETHGPTQLVAAMRCYVASKLGDEVDVPEELLEQSSLEGRAAWLETLESYEVQEGSAK